MTPSNGKVWQALSRQVLLDRAPWLAVAVERIRLPNGVIIDDYFMVETLSWVAVFAVTADGRVPLVRQYRYGIDRCTLELPAGYLEDGEDPEHCARRELREEAGCAAGAFRSLGQFAIMPTRSRMTVHVILAEDAQVVGEQALEATEDIEVQWVTLAELRDLWRGDGAQVDFAEIAGAGHYAAIGRGLAALGML
ncbi:MAG: NUDIX hydrolase [Anaerolineae bacterium]|nr:NUDIX hydrolase [Anaerolineae bacterium]